MKLLSQTDKLKLTCVILRYNTVSNRDKQDGREGNISDSIMNNSKNMS